MSSEQPPKVTLAGFGVEYPILEPVHEDRQWTTNAVPHINDHVGALRGFQPPFLPRRFLWFRVQRQSFRQRQDLYWLVENRLDVVGGNPVPERRLGYVGSRVLQVVSNNGGQERLHGGPLLGAQQVEKVAPVFSGTVGDFSCGAGWVQGV